MSKKISELNKQDCVINSENKPAKINALYDTHIPEKMFELEMEDGSIIKASGNHLWYCETDEDRLNKKQYLSLAKYYFKKNPDLKLLDEEKDDFFELPVIIDFLSNDEKTADFIEKICFSLGHSAESPTLHLDKKIGVKDITLEKVWSINDVIKMLLKFKKEIIEDKKGYFYFGKVRTTAELFQCLHLNIFIPTIEDIKGGNL